MQRVCVRFGRQADDSKFEEMFCLADINGDERLSFEEFLLMQARRALKERGEPADHIPTGSRKARELSAKTPPQSDAQNGAAGGGEREGLGRQFGDWLLRFYRESEPEGKGIVDEETLRWLLSRCHEELRGEPIKEAHMEKIMLLADPDRVAAAPTPLAAFAATHARRRVTRTAAHQCDCRSPSNVSHLRRAM